MAPATRLRHNLHASPRRAGGLIRTVLEQYDFVIYGTATAIVFNRIFFPSVEPAVGVIAGFATYAVGFLARPLGGSDQRIGLRYAMPPIQPATPAHRPSTASPRHG